MLACFELKDFLNQGARGLNQHSKIDVALGQLYMRGGLHLYYSSDVVVGGAAVGIDLSWVVRTDTKYPLLVLGEKIPFDTQKERAVSALQYVIDQAALQVCHETTRLPSFPKFICVPCPLSSCDLVVCDTLALLIVFRSCCGLT